MIGEHDQNQHLPAAVEVELTAHLAAWADRQRLSEAQASTIRAQVLAMASVAPRVEPVRSTEMAAGFDSDWLWSLLRPVTALMERTSELTEAALPNAVDRWLQPLVGPGAKGPYRTYLRLA